MGNGGVSLIGGSRLVVGFGRLVGMFGRDVNYLENLKSQVKNPIVTLAGH